MTNIDTPSEEEETVTVALPQRSALNALYLLVVLGFLGAHRMYLGKWLSGLLIPVVVFSLASAFDDDTLAMAYAAFFFVELAFLRRWTRIKNENILAEFDLHPERFLIADEDHIAPWARGKEKHSRDGVNRVAWRTAFFFLVLPGLTGYWAAQLHSLELLIIPIVLLAAIGLITSLDKTLARFPTLLEVPGVGPALERVEGMRAHYWEHEPKIMGAFYGLFRHGLTRYRPYWSLVSIVVATVIIEGIINYEDNTSYLPMEETLYIIGITALLAALVTLVNLVPVTALAFHYSLSGKTLRLRLMTLGAVLATVVGYTASTTIVEEHASGAIPSTLSAMRLDRRMENPVFREEVKKRLGFFLNYYVGSDTKPETMREELVNLMQSIAPNDESIAFGIADYENASIVQYFHEYGACATDLTTGLPVARADAPTEFEDLENEGETVIKTVEPYQILALIHKPTLEEQEIKLDKLIKERKTAVEIMKALDQKNVYYRWDELSPEMQSFFDAIPEICRALLCDAPSSCKKPASSA